MAGHPRPQHHPTISGVVNLTPIGSPSSPQLAEIGPLGGAELRCRLGPGVAASLIAADRLKALQGDFAAAGGQGLLAPGNIGLILLWRDRSRPQVEAPLPLVGLRLESSSHRWDLVLVHEAGWEDSEAGGVALVRANEADSGSVGVWERNGLFLCSPDRDQVFRLPDEWLEILADVEPERGGES